LEAFEAKYLRPAQDSHQRETTQVAEINTAVETSLKKQEKAVQEVAKDSSILRSTIEALSEEIDRKITSSEQRLHTQIEKLGRESAEAAHDVKEQVKTLQEDSVTISQGEPRLGVRRPKRQMT
jgi:hypothetical protein